MTIRTILTTIHSGVDPSKPLDAALAVARRFGAEINALYVSPNISAELAYAPDVMALRDVDYAAFARLSEQRADLARSRFYGWQDSHPDARGVSYWIEQEGFLEEVVEHQGRLSDLLVLSHPDSKHPDTERAFDTAVFGSGRPCLLIRRNLPRDLFEHVVVAWNGSLQGTRAISGAMPLLRAASAVTVFSAPETYDYDKHGQELAQALGKHGVAAHVARPGDPDMSAGAALLTLASVAGATLIVMGAYTHSRIRQRLLGGMTRHLLSHATVPLLMAH